MVPTNIIVRITPAPGPTLPAGVEAAYFASFDVTGVRIAPTALMKRTAKVRRALRQSLLARAVSVYQLNIRAMVPKTALMVLTKMPSFARTGRQAAPQTCLPAETRTVMSAVCLRRCDVTEKVTAPVALMKKTATPVRARVLNLLASTAAASRMSSGVMENRTVGMARTKTRGLVRGKSLAPLTNTLVSPAMEQFDALPRAKGVTTKDAAPMALTKITAPRLTARQTTSRA